MNGVSQTIKLGGGDGVGASLLAMRTPFGRTKILLPSSNKAVPDVLRSVLLRLRLAGTLRGLYCMPPFHSSVVAHAALVPRLPVLNLPPNHPFGFSRNERFVEVDLAPASLQRNQTQLFALCSGEEPPIALRSS